MLQIRILMSALLVCAGSIVYSQEYSLKDGYFNTILESGVGTKVNVKFAISKETIDTLMKHPAYLYWDSTTYSKPADDPFIVKHKGRPHFEAYLSSMTVMASIWAQVDIKVKDSYSPIEGSEGRIRIDEMGQISVVHPFQAQNGYGNMVYCKGFYLTSWVNGKTQTTHFVR